VAAQVETHIEYPFTVDKVRKLQLGDVVTLTGRIYTARDRVHKYLFDGNPCPVSLKDSAIYHCGPVIIRDDGHWISRAAGPTTSARYDLYMPNIIQKHRVRVIIGKGGMGIATCRACAKVGCVYLQAVGGAAQVLNDRIQRVVDVHFRHEFGMAEAMWELDVADFPAIVAIDAEGRSLHNRVKVSSKRHLNKLIRSNGRKFKF